MSDPTGKNPGAAKNVGAAKETGAAPETGAEAVSASGLYATLPDAELVVRTQRGDTRAFDELVKRYREKVYRLAFKIISRCGGAEGKRTGVLLFLRHILIYPLGEFSCADNKQPCCQRIECSCMANFLNPDNVANFLHHIKRCPA